MNVFYLCAIWGILTNNKVQLKHTVAINEVSFNFYRLLERNTKRDNGVALRENSSSVATSDRFRCKVVVDLQWT